MSDAPEVSVVIVSYNTREMTLDCLRALFAEIAGVSAEVWVVDNASTDGSVAAIEKEFPQVRLIANAKNGGFGAANNQAMHLATGRYFLLLNTDAFPKPGAVSALLKYLYEHSLVGAVGPRLLNPCGSLQVSCFRFPSPGNALVENLWLSAFLPRELAIGDYRRWLHHRQRKVDFVIGACMLVRREVFEQTRGFDEQFFMYAEDADWQRRMWDLGWEVAFTPAAEVTHLGGASGAREKARVNRYFFESLDCYELKHHGLAGLVVLRLAMIVGCLLRSLVWSLFLLIPKRRAQALSKVRAHCWLVWRQISHWRFTRLTRDRPEAGITEIAPASMAGNQVP